jgi:AcrR family transcriptional regulator
MSPKTKEQYEGIRQEKKDLILDTALEVFATHGFHGSSISMIAKHAGIAKGLMYNYFDSKEELLKAILNKGVQNIMKVFTQVLNQEITPDIFKQLLELYFSQLKENSVFWRLYFSIAIQPSVMEMIEKEFVGMVNPYMEMLQKYYTNQGSGQPEADALLAHAIIDGITMNFVITHHDFDMKIIEELVIRRLIKPSF